MNFSNKFSSLIIESGSRDVWQPFGLGTWKNAKKGNLPPMTASTYGSITYSGGIFKEFEDFSMSTSIMSVIASEWAVLGCGPAGDRTTLVSRIEMRLLRARGYWSIWQKTIIGQQ